MAEKNLSEKLSQIGIIKCPYMTEKMTRNIESSNTLPFIVKKTANKEEIKKAVEQIFDVKIKKINTIISTKGEKKAIVKLKEEYNAFDIASNMGMI
ncbi:MAG: 50S ribosomal protein L23 [Candidatus Aenigmarchaeota archaeon]|nr:50S ribosomal protein L23 [Candidatus Aenigmarchaeota archaeon]